MVYTKNYYHVLGLETPSPSRPRGASPSTEEIRKAYRNALLSAHPDKAAAAATRDARRRQNGSNTVCPSYTVDHVKEAFAVLGDADTKLDYDRWLASLAASSTSTSTAGVVLNAPSADFILGLEVLDLSDFEATITSTFTATSASTSVSSSSVTRGNERGSGEGEGEGDEDGEEQTEWIKGCRCGAEKGFVITEGELEGAVERGESEVLVGCRGCSLWVRVGFDVEEG